MWRLKKHRRADAFSVGLESTHQASPAGRITSKYRPRVVVARARDRPARHSRERARLLPEDPKAARAMPWTRAASAPRARGRPRRRRARLRPPRPPRATPRHDATRRVRRATFHARRVARASLASRGLLLRLRATRRPSRACTISCITPSSPSPARRCATRGSERAATNAAPCPPPRKHLHPAVAVAHPPSSAPRRGCARRRARPDRHRSLAHRARRHDARAFPTSARRAGAVTKRAFPPARRAGPTTAACTRVRRAVDGIAQFSSVRLGRARAPHVINHHVPARKRPPASCFQRRLFRLCRNLANDPQGTKRASAVSTRPRRFRSADVGPGRGT